MIFRHNIEALVSGHRPSYVHGYENFVPGETPVYYSGPYWDERELVAAIDSFLNGTWVTAGSGVHAFEEAFSKRFNFTKSLMVNSGSSANLVMVAGLKKHFGWNDGDEIIVCPSGFATTMSVIYQNRLVPVFTDIEWDTLNFDLDEVEAKITPKTKAVFLSPVLGNPPDMDRLLDICYKHALELILDGCDSLGSKWKGRYLSEYAVATSHSFYPTHHIATGEGGMIGVHDKSLMKTMVSLAWWGRDCYCMGPDNFMQHGVCGKRFSKWLPNYDKDIDHKYVFSNMGYNLKPLDLQGAIGLVQLEKIDEIEANRGRSKNVISAIFCNAIEGVRCVTELPDAETSWFATPFICEKEGLKHALVKHLEAHKIQTRNYFAGNILIHPGYSFLGDYMDYPEANKVLDKVFFVGASPLYTDAVFAYFRDVANSFSHV